MKKIAAIFLLFFAISALSKAQNVIEEVRLSNKKIIVIFDDNTWKYKLENTFRTDDETIKTDSIQENISNNVKIEKPKTEEKKETFICGARTKDGYCKRKVYKKGERCWKHAR